MKLKNKSTCRKFISLSILVLFFLISCSSRPPYVKPGYPKPYKVNGEWYQPIPHATDFRERGIASWYGEDFHGKKTSNGEIYDMYEMTAAHKTLPLGTHVKVINLDNDREAEVRINDRGPFVQGRIIDLSYEAAKRIGVVGPGTAKVEIIALGKEIEPGSGKIVPVDYYSGNFTFQVGAFIDKRNAERLLAKLDKKYPNAHMMIYERGDEIFYRVRVGQCRNLESTAAFVDVLKKDGYTDVFTVAE